jgi:trk system potassium uptake protein TrkA
MKKFAVIGIGTFGFYLTKTLFEEGHEVVAIDLDRNRVQAISNFCTEAIVMDATVTEGLKALGLEEMNCIVVSTGSNISSSILICLHLQEFGVKKILAKALDEDHNKILIKMGATKIINPEMAMAIRAAKELSKPNVIDFIPLAEGYSLIQVGPPRAFIGKTFRQLDLRAKYGVYIIAIKEVLQENFVLVPPADFVIKDSDILIMLGMDKDIKRIRDLK